MMTTNLSPTQQQQQRQAQQNDVNQRKQHQNPMVVEQHNESPASCLYMSSSSNKSQCGLRDDGNDIVNMSLASCDIGESSQIMSASNQISTTDSNPNERTQDSPRKQQPVLRGNNRIDISSMPMIQEPLKQQQYNQDLREDTKNCLQEQGHNNAASTLTTSIAGTVSLGFDCEIKHQFGQTTKHRDDEDKEKEKSNLLVVCVCIRIDWRLDKTRLICIISMTNKSS